MSGHSGEKIKSYHDELTKTETSKGMVSGIRVSVGICSHGINWKF